MKSIRNSLVATSVLYVILGVVLMAFPDSSLKLACALIGVVTLIYGGIRIVSYFQNGGAYANRFDLFLGVISGDRRVFAALPPVYRLFDPHCPGNLYFGRQLCRPEKGAGYESAGL